MKTWPLLLAALLAPLPAAADPFGALMASQGYPPVYLTGPVGTLSVDGTPLQTAGTTQTVSGSITTTKANDVIVLLIRSAPSVDATTVSSISDAAGLTWAKRGSTVTYNTASPFAKLEVWYAVAPSILSADSISITIGANSAYATRFMAFAVNGANTTTPFDPSGQVSNTGPNGTSTLSATVTTTKAATMLIGFLSGATTLGTVTRPSSFTAIATSGSNSADYSDLVISSAITGQSKTWTWGTAVSGGVGLVVDAIQASGQ